MSTLTAGKIAEIYFENVIETYEHQDQLLGLVSVEEYDPATMQNAGNVVWRPVQQHVELIDGWDLSGQEQGIIEETCPFILGTPKNDWVKQRIDDLRDSTFWERRGAQAGRQQATTQNKAIADAIITQGSLFYTSAASSGYDFISEGQVQQNERQLANDGRCFVLNDRDNKKFGEDLAARQTLQGRPEQVWMKGQIGQNVAEYDIFTGSYLRNLVGGVSPDTTVTGNQSFKPEAGTVDQATGQVTNIDYRTAVIPVADSSAYVVGDKIKFVNPGTGDVEALALADKNSTNQAMTFSIVGKPDGTSITVYPKPIAYDDGALSTEEKAYANIDTVILNTAVVERLNTVTGKANIFWNKGSVQVISGIIPAHLFNQSDGKRVIQKTMKNGIEMYMIYDSDISDMTFRYRLFAWYGVTVSQPQNCGVALTA